MLDNIFGILDKFILNETTVLSGTTNYIIIIRSILINLNEFNGERIEARLKDFG